MTIKSKTKASLREPATPAQRNLSDVLDALNGHKTLSETRLRDLRSSIRQVASLLGDEPAHIALDLRAIGAKLATVFRPLQV
jgi:hypothetical protein